MSLKCPECGRKLEKVVRSPYSPLNEHQFDAVKAGDWYCAGCPSNDRGNSGYRYFWLKEVLHTCDHEDFAASVDVHRLDDVRRFQADVRVQCRECGKPFRFIGLPAGVDLNGASTSADATEARLAIAPLGEVLSVLEDAPTGFSIRKQ